MRFHLAIGLGLVRSTFLYVSWQASLLPIENFVFHLDCMLYAV